MSDLYEGQFRRGERARLRNKHEERRLQQELERKHGMRETHEYRMCVMTQERQLIEKELGKIRMGIRRNSSHPEPGDNTAGVEDVTARSVQDESDARRRRIAPPPPLRTRAMSLQDASDRYRTRCPSPLPPQATPSHDLIWRPLPET